MSPSMSTNFLDITRHQRLHAEDKLRYIAKICQDFANQHGVWTSYYKVRNQKEKFENQKILRLILLIVLFEGRVQV